MPNASPTVFFLAISWPALV